MFELDGSETSWLVYADWLEDQGLNAAHIRESAVVNDWYHTLDMRDTVAVNEHYCSVGGLTSRIGGIYSYEPDYWGKIGAAAAGGMIGGSFWFQNGVGGRGTWTSL
jgi:hypothetical protein